MSVHPASYERGFVGSKLVSFQASVPSTNPVNIVLCREEYSGIAVLVKSDKNNSGNIYIGGDDLTGTSDGYLLEPGEAVVIPIDNPCKIWAVSDSGTNKLYVLVVK